MLAPSCSAMELSTRVRRKPWPDARLAGGRCQGLERSCPPTKSPAVGSEGRVAGSPHALSARITARGFAAATRSRARAGPSGERRPCSQFRRVATLTPIRRANSVCDLPRFSLIARTSSRLKWNTRDGRRAPRRIAPAWRMLVTRVSNSLALTETPPVPDAEEPEAGPASCCPAPVCSALSAPAELPQSPLPRINAPCSGRVSKASWSCRYSSSDRSDATALVKMGVSTNRMLHDTPLAY